MPCLLTIIVCVIDHELNCTITLTVLHIANNLRDWRLTPRQMSSCSATCIVLYTQHCSRLNYRTASMRCRACHQQTSYNQPCWCHLDRNCDHHTRLPPKLLMTPRIPPPAHRRGRGSPFTVADVHKFLAVRRLSWRLFDRSKNAILPTHLYLVRPPPVGNDQ